MTTAELVAGITISLTLLIVAWACWYEHTRERRRRSHATFQIPTSSVSNPMHGGNNGASIALAVVTGAALAAAQQVPSPPHPPTAHV